MTGPAPFLTLFTATILEGLPKISLDDPEYMRYPMVYLRIVKKAVLALFFHRNIIVLFLLMDLSISFSGCVGFISGNFDPSRTVDAERKISGDPSYKEVDDLCKSFSLPSDSKFVGKARLFNRVGIMNFYRTSQPAEDIDRHFRELMLTRGWTWVEDSPVNFLNFRKGVYEVNIQIGGIGPDISYSVDCLRERVTTPTDVLRPDAATQPLSRASGGRTECIY